MFFGFNELTSHPLWDTLCPNRVPVLTRSGEQVDPNARGPVSGLLERWQAGDSKALDDLVPYVYADLRRVAHHYLNRERSGHTLQSAALVHEAYLRLANHEKMRFENRAHFFAVLANIMRQILVDYARNKHAAKRDVV